MKLTFLDTETTGLPKDFPNNDGPEITEYCLATWTDGLVTDVVHVLIQPQNAPAADAEGIVRTPNGFPLSYRPDVWRQRKAKAWDAEDGRRMFDRIDNQYVAGSNPQFDLDRIQWELLRYTQVGPRSLRPQHRQMNLNSLGFPLWVAGLVEGTGLGHLAKYYGVEHDAHTSNGDVLASIAVFEKLLDDFIVRPKRMAEFCRDVAECYATEAPELSQAAWEAVAL